MNNQSPFENTASPQSPLPFSSIKTSDIENNFKVKEMRIIKQAIAKSFIESGHAKFSPMVEEEMKKWIKWCYQYDEELTK